jgi:hypothetical protein
MNGVYARFARPTVVSSKKKNKTGWTPKWIINQACKTMGPEMFNTLYESGKKYEQWKNAHNPQLRPWRDGHYKP